MLSDYGLTKEEVHAHKMFEVSEFINQEMGTLKI